MVSFSRPRSRSPRTRNTSCSLAPSKVAQSLISKRDEVDAIVQKLREKHQDRFTPPQINTWAHCIQMKTHSSYDEPPDKPFSGVVLNNPSLHLSTICQLHLLVERSLLVNASICALSVWIKLIEKWHELFTKGIISEEQHKELVEKVWNDIKKF